MFWLGPNYKNVYKTVENFKSSVKKVDGVTNIIHCQ